MVRASRLIALVIYGLALRKRLERRQAANDDAADDSGQRPARRQPADAERRDGRGRPLCRDRLAPRAGALNGIAHLFEHMVFKGAGGRSAREISEAIEDVGGDLNACDRPRADRFLRAACCAEDLAARRRADRRPGPRPAFRRRSISSSRRRSCCRSWPKRATRRRTWSSTICRRPPSTTSRSAARSSASEASIRARHGGRSPRLAGDAISRRRADPGRGRQARA